MKRMMAGILCAALLIVFMSNSFYSFAFAEDKVFSYGCRINDKREDDEHPDIKAKESFILNMKCPLLERGSDQQEHMKNSKGIMDQFVNGYVITVMNGLELWLRIVALLFSPFLGYPF